MSKSFYILGVDQGIASSGVAVVCFTKDKEEWVPKLLHCETIKTASPYYIGTRLVQIETKLLHYLSLYPFSLIGCEALFFSSRRKEGNRNKSASMLYTSYATSMLYLISQREGIFLKPFTPGTVKKHLTGDGRATKEAMVEAIRTQFNLEGKLSEHAADAAAIALITGAFYLENMEACQLYNAQIKAQKKMT